MHLSVKNNLMNNDITYESTRGLAPRMSFKGAVMAGLAEDGGLYLPSNWPAFSSQEINSLRGMSYSELAYAVISRFTGSDIPEEVLRNILVDCYRQPLFNHPAIAPLVQIDHNEFILELFHGETLAFKDFALQFLSRILDYFLEGQGAGVNIIGATSGDTGSAAINACKGRKNIAIFILHPHNKVSEVQRRMMTTPTDYNIHNLAIEGDFDDCQNIVKSLFADKKLKADLRLTAINSINWARIVAQVVYYFYAGLTLNGRINFSVPTGNFGDVYAGYIASRLGLDTGRFIIGTNCNDILNRALRTGYYNLEPTKPSISPSIDIQVSSNFERILFESNGREAMKIRALMEDLKTKRGFLIDAETLDNLRKNFTSSAAAESETMQTMKEVYSSSGYLLDPHTAVAVKAGREIIKAGTREPLVHLATAHPAKFPVSVQVATGVNPVLPERLKWITTAPEKLQVLPANSDAVRQYLIRNSI